MPRAEILSKQALNTLTQLHAELAGKIETNRKSGDKPRSQMVQVEAVMKMLDPEFSARSISAKRRNTGNPWFRRGTMYRSAVDVLRQAGTPMTAREITLALLDGKTPTPSRKQEKDAQAVILAALQDHAGSGVEQVGEVRPAQWRLKTNGRD
ncbi:MAG: hypothetical protein JWQ49_3039 [Edaphobacter sp.]|nr:hypothetical protein [Edaphobacter sp.]